jgi:hypothetical protein
VYYYRSWHMVANGDGILLGIPFEITQEFLFQGFSWAWYKGCSVQKDTVLGFDCTLYGSWIVRIYAFKESYKKEVLNPKIQLHF